MKKKLFIITGCAFLIIVIVILVLVVTTGKIKPLAEATVPTLSLDPVTQVVQIDSTFSTNIILDTAGQAVDGVDIFYLNYDPQVLEVQDADPTVEGVQIAKGTIFPIYMGNSVDVTNGKIAISGVIIPGGEAFTGTGIFATINFKALSLGSTSVYFDFLIGLTTDTNVAEHGTGLDILQEVVNANYTIQSEVPTPSPSSSTLSPKPEPPKTPSPTPTSPLPTPTPTKTPTPTPTPTKTPGIPSPLPTSTPMPIPTQEPTPEEIAQQTSEPYQPSPADIAQVLSPSPSVSPEFTFTPEPTASAEETQVAGKKLSWPILILIIIGAGAFLTILFFFWRRKKDDLDDDEVI